MASGQLQASIYIAQGSTSVRRECPVSGRSKAVFGWVSRGGNEFIRWKLVEDEARSPDHQEAACEGGPCLPCGEDDWAIRPQRDLRPVWPWFTSHHRDVPLGVTSTGQQNRGGFANA